MWVVTVDKKGKVIGRRHIENAFYRKQDLCINNKAIKIKVFGQIYGLVLITTNAEEYRLLGDRKEVYVTAYPDSFDRLYFHLGDDYKLFAIDVLKIDAGGYLRPLVELEKDTLELEKPVIDESWA